MPSPFPGMNPYLESPELWTEVHSRLIVAIADEIAPALLPNYYVAIEKRTYLTAPEDSVLIGIPDVSVVSQGVQAEEELERNNTSTATLSKPDEPQTVTVPLAEEVQERYLEIRDTKTGRVVTTIELLSPKNKRSGEGREAYLRKRQRILTSSTHLVEIDLLRNSGNRPIYQGNTTRPAKKRSRYYAVLQRQLRIAPKAKAVPCKLPANLAIAPEKRLSPPFAPAVQGWARTVLLSISQFSQSFNSPQALEMTND